MATYYVRPDGNDSNTGLGSTAALAWQTITKAIGATGIAPGDTLYIAPGTYRGSFTAAFTNPANEGQRITIAGNPSASLFSGITAGPVVITNYTSTTASTGATVLTIYKDYITLQDVIIFGFVAGGSPLFGIVSDIQSTAFIGTRIYCHTSEANTQSRGFQLSTSGNTTGPIISNSVFIGGFLYQGLPASSYDSGTIIRDSIFIKTSTSSADTQAALQLLSNPGGRLGGISIANCSFFAGGSCISTAWFGAPSTTNGSTIRNCYFRGTTGINSTSTSIFTETYNVFECQVDRVLTNTGTGSVSRAYNPIDLHISNIQQWGILPFTAPITGAYGISAGITTGAPTSDIFGVNWLAAPTIGSTESAQIVNRYYPTERNASTITIAPGSTSQSIELYLGATGLTASTSGLSAYYNRTRSADVQIPLVARTIGQAWTSGGFAEVNASTMPGVYRLDLPDAAVAAGADDVTVVVRGASGTNGAVMTIKLSSGGLTAAQTASAILDAVGASYVTAGSIGYAIQNSNVASISGSTAAADELEGALLHNGTDYISAQLIAGGGGGAGDVGGNIINLNEDPEVVVQSSAWVGDWHTYVLRLVDSNGTPYDITNDTLAVTFTNVATGSAYAFGGGSATITKQMNGQGILSILNPAAYPSAAVIRLTVSATVGTDVRRFGPLEIEVLAP